jgi:hypothetical protein
MVEILGGGPVAHAAKFSFVFGFAQLIGFGKGVVDGFEIEGSAGLEVSGVDRRSGGHGPELYAPSDQISDNLGDWGRGMNRVVIILLALSPIAFLGWIGACTAGFDNPLLTLVCDLFVLVPVAVLVFSRSAPLSPGSRRMLIFALGCFLLLLPAVVMHFGPAISMGSGGGSVIRLDPPPHQMPAEGAAFLRGLNVKDGVMILKWGDGQQHDDPSPFSACDYMDWHSPPSHFTDENGNGLDFKLTGTNVLHFQDDRGGYADVQWTGSAFVLVGSQSAGQSNSATSPTAAGSLAGRVGNLLLFLTPMVAWVFVTAFAWKQIEEQNGTPAVSLILGGILQILGMVILSFAIMAAPEHGDEVDAGLMALFLLVGVAASLAGLAILAGNLFRIRLSDQSRADNRSVDYAA